MKSFNYVKGSSILPSEKALTPVNHASECHSYILPSVMALTADNIETLLSPPIF